MQGQTLDEMAKYILPYVGRQLNHTSNNMYLNLALNHFMQFTGMLSMQLAKMHYAVRPVNCIFQPKMGGRVIMFADFENLSGNTTPGTKQEVVRYCKKHMDKYGGRYPWVASLYLQEKQPAEIDVDMYRT